MKKLAHDSLAELYSDPPKFHHINTVLGVRLKTTTLKEISFIFQPTELKKGDLVYGEGDRDNWVYTIVTGSIELSCTDLAGDKKGQSRVDRLQSKEVAKKRLRISLLGEGVMFGQECILNYGSYATDASVQSLDCFLYKIEKKHLATLEASLKEEKGFKAFMEGSQAKLCWLLDRIRSSRRPSKKNESERKALKGGSSISNLPYLQLLRRDHGM